MARPNRIKIGALDYAVEFVGADWTIKSDRRGEVDYIDLKIRVLDILTPYEMADTFMHEVTHALMQHYDRNCQRPIPYEEVAVRMGAGLVMVWRDNPEVFAWWSELIAVAPTI